MDVNTDTNINTEHLTIDKLREHNHDLRKLLSTVERINCVLKQQLSRCTCECECSQFDEQTQSNITELTIKYQHLKQRINNDMIVRQTLHETTHELHCDLNSLQDDICDAKQNTQNTGNDCQTSETDTKLTNNCELLLIDVRDCEPSLDSVDTDIVIDNLVEFDTNKHLSTHENHCEYSCEFSDTKTGLFCEKKFNSKQSLLKHVIGHTGDKPWFCEGYDCDYRAIHRNHLIGHLRKSHTGRYQFMCDWPGCEFRAPSRYNVRRHRIIHTGEKPFKCDWPGCHFSSPNNKIAAHKRLHTGERPYACDWPGCDMSFSRSFTLRNHKRTHTGEKPFACDWPGCQYRSTQQTPLQTHKRKKHNSSTIGSHQIILSECVIIEHE